MSKLPIFTAKGTKSGELEFPKKYLAKEKEGFMAQAHHVFEDRSHKGTSKVQTRAEVSLSTRKIYKQKGTGGARHGSKKAPIFVGGGVAHGPKGVKRTLSLSKKLNKVALGMFLSAKVKAKKVCFVSGVDSVVKTKDANSLLESVCKGLGSEKAKRVHVVLGTDKKNVYKFFRNIKGITVGYWDQLNLREVYLSTLLVIDKDAVEKKAEKVKKEINKEVKAVKKTVKKTK